MSIYGQQGMPIQRCVRCMRVLNRLDTSMHPFRCQAHNADTQSPTWCGWCGARLVAGHCPQHPKFRMDYQRVYDPTRVPAPPSAPAPIATETIQSLVARVGDPDDFFALVVGATESVVTRGIRLTSRDRTEWMTNARRLACWIAKRYGGQQMSTTRMGRGLSRKHTSVIRLLRDFDPLATEPGARMVRDIEIELHRRLLKWRHEFYGRDQAMAAS